MSNQTHALTVGQRVEVVNLQSDKTPGAYHGCTCRIIGFFPHEGQPCAKVMFAGGIEKKITLDKLQPVAARIPFQKSAPALRSSYIPRLPSWARRNTAMYRGDELLPGDMVYFTPQANPRELQRQVDASTWHGVTIAVYKGFVKRYPGNIDIAPSRWYVVERKAVNS